MARRNDRWSQYNQPKYDMTFSRELWSKKEARKEYNRLAFFSNIMQKAVAKTKEFAGRFKFQPAKPLPQTASEAQVRKSLSDVARQLASAKTSATKRRQTEARALRTLGKHGYGFVNRQNLKEFGDFMEAARSHYGKRSYDSERVALMFKNAKKSGIAPEKVQEAFEEYQKRGLDRKPLHYKDLKGLT